MLFSRLISLFWAGIHTLFLVVLVLVYANLKDFINIRLSPDSAYMMDKEYFFYQALGLVAVINILIMLKSLLIPYLPKEWLPLPNKAIWFANAKNAKKCHLLLKAWLRGLAAALTLFVLWIVIFIFSQNAENPFAADWALLPVVVALGTWMLVYLWLFRQKPEQL